MVYFISGILRTDLWSQGNGILNFSIDPDNSNPRKLCWMTLSFSVLNSVAHSFRIFLGSPKLPCVFTFPYRVPVPKNCVIFIGYHFESRASQVGLRKREIKDLRIIGLEERKCRRLVKQYFHRNFRDNDTCIIFLFLPVFSGLLD